MRATDSCNSWLCLIFSWTWHGTAIIFKYVSSGFSKTAPGRVAQSVGHLTRKSGVLGSIPGLVPYFRFSFRFFKEGQLSVTGESMRTKYWLTA